MKILQQDGLKPSKEIERPVTGDIRGLKIDSVTLDIDDISGMYKMTCHGNNTEIINFLNLLSLCMHKPKPTYTYQPIDEENQKLKAAGKNFLCEAKPSWGT